MKYHKMTVSATPAQSRAKPRKRRRAVPTKLTVALLATAVAIGPFVATELKAQQFPDRAVELVVPWPAGGGSDTLMRMLAEATTEPLGQPVVVVNKPGAGGSLGLREVAEASPDGYTVGMIATGFIAGQYDNPNAPVLEDYRIIVYVGTDPAALSASAASGISTLEEFVERARAEPGAIRNGNDQPGGSSYLAIALMEDALGVEVTRVPYGGYAPTIQGLLAGEVDTATVSVPDMAEHHRAGRVTILAVAGDERHPDAPDVATFTELGYPLVTGTTRALVVPAGTPDDVVATLEEAFLAGLNSETFRERATAAGFSLAPADSAAATELVYGMDESMYPVLLDAGLVHVRQK
jgi:tripartite-type tricarboxylate transporter receptor subunit TctC